MEKVAAWLAGPRHRVILIGAALFMVPLLMPLAAALVAFATLLKGPREGVIAALGAAAVLGVVSAIQGGAQAFGLFASALMILGLVVSGATLVGRSGGLDMPFQLGTLAFAGLAGVLAATPAGQSLAGQVGPELARALTGAGADQGQAAQLGEMIASLLFGFALGGMLLSLTVSLLVGRWLEGMARPPASAGENFRALQAGRLVTLVASAVFVGAMLVQGGGLGNAAIVFVMAMLVQGLAVAHAMAQRHTLNRGWLVLLYALLLLPSPLSPFAVMAIAATGYMDNWLGIRRPRGGPPAGPAE